jgi:hypothetical protein
MATQFPQRNGGLIRQHLARQDTTPYQAITLPAVPEPVELSPVAPLASPNEVVEEPLNEPVASSSEETSHHAYHRPRAGGHTWSEHLLDLASNEFSRDRHYAATIRPNGTRAQASGNGGHDSNDGIQW